MIPPIECKFPGIYRFTNLINGKIYVGQARNIYRRHMRHAQLSERAQGIFPKALKKYGFNSFSFDVLEKVEDILMLDQREQYWLDKLQPYIAGIGYNIQTTPNSQLKDKVAYWNTKRLTGRNFCVRKGLPGRKQSEETRKKIAAKATGRICPEHMRLAASARFKGKPISDDAKKKRSLSLSRPVSQIEPLTGKVIRVWLSAQYVTKMTGLTLCTIRECCMGYYWDSRAKKRNDRSPFYAGFNWQYATPEQMAASSQILDSIDEFKPIKQKKQIRQIEIETEATIKVWPSITQASKELLINYAGIASACKGFCYRSDIRANEPVGPLYAGFKWEYVGL